MIKVGDKVRLPPNEKDEYEVVSLCEEYAWLKGEPFLGGKFFTAQLRNCERVEPKYPQVCMTNDCSLYIRLTNDSTPWLIIKLQEARLLVSRLQAVLDKV